MKIGNSRVDIPNVLRRLRDAEIIKLYKKKKEQENVDLKNILPDSVMFKVLKTCTATRTHSMQCVDYFIVEGSEVNSKIQKYAKIKI